MTRKRPGRPPADQPSDAPAWAARLRAAREGMGLTMTEMSSRAGIALDQYSRYESGANKPGVDAALRLAAAAGLTVEGLFGG